MLNYNHRILIFASFNNGIIIIYQYVGEDQANGGEWGSRTVNFPISFTKVYTVVKGRYGGGTTDWNNTNNVTLQNIAQTVHHMKNGLTGIIIGSRYSANWIAIGY